MHRAFYSRLQDDLRSLSLTRSFWNIDRRFRALDEGRLVNIDGTGLQLDWYPLRKRTKKWISPPDGVRIPGIITRDRRPEPARGTWELWEPDRFFGTDIGVPDAFERLARRAVACIRHSGPWGKHILSLAGRTEGNVVDSVTIWIRLLWLMEFGAPGGPAKHVTFKDPCGSSADLCIWLKSSYDAYIESGFLPRRIRGRPPGQCAKEGEIRRLRNKNGFTQSALASRSGVPLRVIQRAEAGKAIGLPNLKAIADTLGANQDDLVSTESLTQQ